VLLAYSPVIRKQYAARNPISPEPTVRFNDVAFTAHALVLSALTLSMFWRRLWGFEQRRGQRISPGIMGIGIVCILGVLWTVVMVLAGGGEDPEDWAWIDVVGRCNCNGLHDGC
jgi:cystinosin